jgi:hypothetical protein
VLPQSGRRSDLAFLLLRETKSEGNKVSFLEKMRAAAAEAVQPIDPWRLRLERVRGTTGFDGLERISTQTLLDILEVSQRQRTAGSCRRLAKLMAELGWTAVRVRDLTMGGYKEQVRGYVRNAHRQTPLTKNANLLSPVAGPSRRREPDAPHVGVVIPHS